jgi:hypothetical protein
MGSTTDYYWDNQEKFDKNKTMSDREIMNAKSGILKNSKKIKVYMDDEINQIITTFEEEYPELSTEFSIIQEEQYELFAKKMLDYGLNNITLGGDIVNNSDDKKFSLTGLTIRLTDKINRLRNLVVSGKNYVKDEGMEDTFIDIANYGIIGLLVGRNKWKK